MKRIAVNFFVISILLSFSIGCTLKQRRYFVSSIPFDEKQWKINDTETRWNIRAGMARDLVNRKVLIGKSRSEISEILGELEEDQYQKSKKILYTLEEAYFGIEPTWKEYLMITLDENDKVKNAEIYLRKFR